MIYREDFCHNELVCYNEAMKLDFNELNQVEIIVTIIMGLLLLLAGYKIKKIAFFVVWFLIGFNLMQHLMPWINGWMPDIVGTFWQTLLPIAGGLLLALMGFTIEKVCVAGIVFGVVLMIGSQFGTDIQTLAISAVIGVIAAGAAVMLIKPAIIIVTSLAGAYTITLGAFFFAQDVLTIEYFFPMLIGITAVGSVMQFLTTKNE